MPTPRSTRPLDRFMDLVFGGKPATAEAVARFEAERPPRWAQNVVGGAYLVWFCGFAGWCIGTQGWLPLPREEFTVSRLLWVNGVGVAIQFLSEGVRRHYAKKAGEAMKAASAE
jgi:hypothetical protein